jgi:hypothetical protein
MDSFSSEEVYNYLQEKLKEINFILKNTEQGK